MILIFVFDHRFIEEIGRAYLVQLFFSSTYILQGFAVKLLKLLSPALKFIWDQDCKLFKLGKLQALQVEKKYQVSFCWMVWDYCFSSLKVDYLHILIMFW